MQEDASRPPPVSSQEVLPRELCPSCSEDPEESVQRPGRSLPPHLELKLTFVCTEPHHQTLDPWAAFCDDEWVGQFGNELTTVSVAVHSPAVEHHVRVKDFLAWLKKRAGRHAEVSLREKLTKMLA